MNDVIEIYLNDRRIHRVHKSSGTGDHHSSWTEKYEYCPLCLGDVKISEATGKGSFIGAIFIIVFMLGFMSIAWGMFSKVSEFGGDGFGPPPILFTFLRVIFIGIPGLIIILFILKIITGPKRADKARQEQQGFINSLDKVPDGIRESYPSEDIYSSKGDHEWSKAEITCLQCGNQLNLSDIFCPSCGDSTSDERKYYK